MRPTPSVWIGNRIAMEAVKFLLGHEADLFFSEEKPVEKATFQVYFIRDVSDKKGRVKDVKEVVKKGRLADTSRVVYNFLKECVPYFKGQTTYAVLKIKGKKVIKVKSIVSPNWDDDKVELTVGNVVRVTLDRMIDEHGYYDCVSSEIFGRVYISPMTVFSFMYHFKAFVAAVQMNGRQKSMYAAFVFSKNRDTLLECRDELKQFYDVALPHVATLFGHDGVYLPKSLETHDIICFTPRCDPLFSMHVVDTPCDTEIVRLIRDTAIPSDSGFFSRIECR